MNSQDPDRENEMLGLLCVIASRRFPADIPEDTVAMAKRDMVVDIRLQFEAYADVRCMRLTDDFLRYDGHITIPCRTDRAAELEVLTMLEGTYGIRYMNDGSKLFDEYFARWKLIDKCEESRRLNNAYQKYHRSLVLDVYSKITKLTTIPEVSLKLKKKSPTNAIVNLIKI